MAPKTALDLELTTSVQIRVTDELLKRIDGEAKKYSMARGAVIRMIIVDYLDMKERKQ